MHPKSKARHAAAMACRALLLNGTKAAMPFYRQTWALSLLVLSLTTVKAQLDTVHWIPPMHGNLFGPQYDHFIYLSTPSAEAVPYTISTPDGTVLVSGAVSNLTSTKHALGSNDQAPLFVPVDSLGVVLRQKGVVIRAQAPIYANYRNASRNFAGLPSHATILTCKGNAARGTEFRIGGAPNTTSSPSATAQRSSFFSVMAMEDGTDLNVTGFRNGTILMGTAPLAATAFTITLDAGESVVLSAYVNAAQPANSEPFLGALLTASAPVVVTNGFFKGFCCPGPTTGHDIGIDQSVPVERIGTEYILIRGEAADPGHERPIIIAHEDGTEVFVNGDATPLATLNSGGYLMLPGSLFSVEGNLYIRTSRPAYCYQHLLGAANPVSAELNFIPPLSCSMPQLVDRIPSVDTIGTVAFSGGVTIISKADADIVVTDQVGSTMLPASSGSPVTGNTAWRTWKRYGLRGDVRIHSTRPMAAGIFGGVNDAGYAGYFSGFDPVPRAAMVVYPGTCAMDSSLVIFDGTSPPNTSVSWDFDGASVLSGEGQGPYLVQWQEPGTYTISLLLELEGCRDSVAQEFVLNDCTVLPVTWIGLDATSGLEGITIVWTVAQQLGAEAFIVQRSNDGMNFHTVASRLPPAAGPVSTYSCTDRAPARGANYYRVSCINGDGTTDHSTTVAVQWSSSDVQAWFHPDSGELILNGSAEADVLELYNGLGQLVAYGHGRGLRAETTSALPAGWYLLRGGDLRIPILKR